VQEASDTIGHMTDEPTDNPSDQPSQPATEPTSPPPSPPPTEPSGVGFAAIRPPSQQAPSGPLPEPPPGPPTYNSYNPPPPPPPSPSGPVYQYDYSRAPKSGGNGAQVVLVALLGFVLVLVVGVGGMLAFGIGPFARATPVATLVAQPTPTAHPITPVPTSSALATSTALASPTDGGAPTPSPTPVASGDVTDALLSHIPLKIEPSCFVQTGDNNIVAVAVCSSDEENIQLSYFQYDSYESMFSAYEGFRMTSQIEPDSGDCNDHDSWPAEAGFNINGQAAGRWLCTEALGQTTIYWTDTRLNILSQATQTVPDYPRLVDFWVHESGPNLEPFSN
jgi:hypothetical protein